MSYREWAVLMLVYGILPVVFFGGIALTMWLKQ